MLTWNHILRLIDKQSALGLLLHFYAAPSDEKTLCEFFCVPPSTMHRTLEKAEVAMENCLKSWKSASIVWPTKQKQREMAECIERKEPLVQCKWGFMDGVNLPVMEPKNSQLQNAYYHGWLHTILVTGVLSFGACMGTSQLSRLME